MIMLLACGKARTELKEFLIEELTEKVICIHTGGLVCHVRSTRESRNWASLSKCHMLQSKR